MRKIFAIFAAALIAFSFASCDKKGGNTPSDPAEKEQNQMVVAETYDNITTDEMPKCNGFSVHLIYVER